MGSSFDNVTPPELTKQFKEGFHRSVPFQPQMQKSDIQFKEAQTYFQRDFVQILIYKYVKSDAKNAIKSKILHN